MAGLKYLLDTNICIYIIKNKPPWVYNKFTSLQVGSVGISSVTLSELSYGVEKSVKREQNQKALEAFILPLSILQFDEVSAFCYGKIRAYLEKKGQIIGAYDLMIAAHALSQNLTLVSNNISEFKRIKGLQLENWA